jgi:para-aminobenzoate synthetase component 1
LKRQAIVLKGVSKETLVSNLLKRFEGQETYAIYDSCKMTPAAGIGRFELLAAWDPIDLICLSPKSVNAFEIIKAFRDKHRDWVFCLLSYDLKNQVEKLPQRSDQEFPDLVIFVPKYVVSLVSGGEPVLHSSSDDAFEVMKSLKKAESAFIDSDLPRLNFIAGFSDQAYLAKVEEIKDQIREGNVYEMNLCRDYYCENVVGLDAKSLFSQLVKQNPSPFTACFVHKDYHLISSSPERFLMKEGERLISQPMKGTIKREAMENDDKVQVDKLRTSEKDLAENIMIVDLVRNDLSRSCKAGTVKVEELTGIYTYPFVHQMISTVSGEIKEGVDPVDALRNCFPMGSMTGTPKIAAMKLIERFEVKSRGWYSGTTGYFMPNGDFDFNVNIRSFFYDRSQKQLFLWAGGAITIDSEDKQEFDEINLKAGALLKLFKD